MAQDPEYRIHHQWLGLLQPVGLVVSPPALIKAGAVIDSNVKSEQDALLKLIIHSEESIEANDDNIRGNSRPWVSDLPLFLQHILGWEPADLRGGSNAFDEIQRFDVFLPDYEETLKATYWVPDARADNAALMLIQVLSPGDVPDLDDTKAFQSYRWQASAQSRFERLLWENNIPLGILFNGTDLRLCYVPRGESSGHVTFPLDEMCRIAGRPILGALKMLLSADRIFSLPSPQRLPAILVESRKYQSTVSNALSEQVLAALRELLSGFQAADEYSGRKLLADILREAPQEVYGGLLSTLLRLVFVLYAEDRSLMPDDAFYVQNYSVGRLFEKLREDAALFPDTMEQRYGAWAQLLSLFRLIFDGAEYIDPDTGKIIKLPPRQGDLFNPDTYAFLEGRPYQSLRTLQARYIPPRISDGVVYRVLEQLLLLEGQRLSYRSLDVEQIGSVYEALMGFELKTALGPSIGVRPDHLVVNLQNILEAKPADRDKLLKEQTGCELTDKAKKRLKEAKTISELMVALEKKISPRTPALIPLGSMYLQPTEERRRSGSHYTPRSLTQPIVQTALQPILEGLGENPTPQTLLELKVCDPAMGSGAFLVEACRQLAETLVAAWTSHQAMPPIPADEDPLLHARRMVAQRCLYGVDKNRFAVDLAKLSLWLATLAKEHPFTFLDHALKHGDSLVGFSKDQILRFDWKLDTQEAPTDFSQRIIGEAAKKGEQARRELQVLDDELTDAAKRNLLFDAENALAQVRLIGDALVAAFFSEEKDKERQKARVRLKDKIEFWLRRESSADEIEEAIAELRAGEHPLAPFHWQIEFPEAFERDNPGFDVFVGNPPFAGKNTTIAGHKAGYLDYLKLIHQKSHGNADLVAHFFRRAFSLLRSSGSFGLIATNTIAQGDTRASGLQWIREHDGCIYHAIRRLKWPGAAAVVVSVIHIAKNPVAQLINRLDGRSVEKITAFLFPKGSDESPAVLRANEHKSFIGSYVLGMGFTFDDTNPDATPIAEMQRIIAKDSRNAERIFPYLGGEEINTSPTHAHHRYVINFEQMSEEEARQWPDLMAIVEEKVKPERQKLGENSDAIRRKKYWWQWGRYTPALFSAIRGMERVLVIARVSNTFAFTFLPSGKILNEKIVVVASDKFTVFTILQSRGHEVWGRFLNSSLKDDMQYTPSDCFETFPFPENWELNPLLEAVGKKYYEFRAGLMADETIRADLMNGLPPEGLTATYNRFHNPDETLPGILQLRKLHDQMDRVVLDAYGWTDIKPRCEFILDYEEEEAAEKVTEEEPESARRRKKKPWRYRWPDEVRDEVLSRLLELNALRAKEEQRLGAEAALNSRAVTRATPKKPKTNSRRVPNHSAKNSTPLLPICENSPGTDDSEGNA